MSLPLVSICLPTLNGSEFLQEALDSIKFQTYKNLEVVVSDDQSTDSTLQIVEEFKRTINLPVKIYHHRSSGIGANWNNCIRRANGEYIKFLFQDDILFPDCIERMVNAISRDKRFAFVACKRKLITEDPVTPAVKDWILNYNDLQKHFDYPEKSEVVLNKKIFKHKSFLEIPHNKIGEPTAVLFRKSVVNKIGYFSDDLRQILDFEFYYRILKHYDGILINRKLVSFRLHRYQATNINKQGKEVESIEYEKIIYEKFFWYLNLKQQKRLFFRLNNKGRFLKKIKDEIFGRQ